MPAFITAEQLREYLDTELTDRKYATGRLQSNIRAASAFLQRETSRQFEVQDDTLKTFTSHGRAQFNIPDLRTATTVSKSGGELAADSGYWLLPDRYSQDIFTSIQFRVFQPFPEGPWYLHDAGWFDKGLDFGNAAGRSWTSLPNDLTILGDWGWDTLPDELELATKVLAGYYTKRPDSLLSGSSVSQDGTYRDYSNLPIEVQDFVRDWNLGDMMVAV